MDTLSAADNAPEISQQQSEVKRFYRPGVLAAYCILANIPIAIFLYGINVHRRGDVLLGNVIKIMAVLTVIAMTIAYACGSNLSGMRTMMPGIVVGIGLMQAERIHFKKAMSEGAIPERWWPPLIFLLIYVLAIILIEYFIVSA